MRALLCALCLLTAAAPGWAAEGFQRVPYNHPGLTVDLGVGLWAWPLPMDIDGDGDLDLVVSCADVPFNGTYLFENPGGAKVPVFRPAKRLGMGVTNVQVSYVAGRARVLTAGFEHPEIATKGLETRVALPVSAQVHTPGAKTRAAQWKYADYDGDGQVDLIVGIGDWTDYGWDNAFNERGEWTRGPLHGYVYLLRNTGTAEEPRYEAPVKLEAGGKPVDVYGMPSPNLADFDGDGDLDLLCGEFVDTLTYFRNSGTRTQPRYDAGRPLLLDGKPLRMDLCMIVPVAVDWDGDGDEDLVVGQEDGRVAFIEHTGRAADGMPLFLAPRFFQQEADSLKCGALATPCSFDWDGDGDEDLVCGDTAGRISFIENLDGGDPPKWAAPKPLQAGGEETRILAGPNGSIQGPAEAKWGYTVLSVADWDHDGLPDIVANSIWGKVVWYRNRGTRTAPRLEPARPVEIEWQGEPPKPAWNWWRPRGKELATQWRTSPVVADVTGDGRNDLVMLDHEGYLALFERRKSGGRLEVLPGKRVFLDAKREPLRLNAGKAGGSGRRKLVLADWDRDGRRDLLVNSRSIDFYRNIGREGEWVFLPMGVVDSRHLAGHTTCPTVVDWDRNGIPDLLAGAEDGYFYHLKNPYPIAVRPRGAPETHLVAAWDFEEGGGGPLADKATSGTHADTLQALGGARVEKGVGIVPGDEGCAFRAAGTPDLAVPAELTLWARVRVDKKPPGIMGLVDKRRFRNPEERSYGLYITPHPPGEGVFGVGGQISASGTAGLAVAAPGPGKGLPAGEWREIALVVERVGGSLHAMWYASTGDRAQAPGDLEMVNGPAVHDGIDRLFRGTQDLLIGNDANLKATGLRMEFDEVRVYDRALTLAELAALRPTRR